jgi:HlyD family secretion protein
VPSRAGRRRRRITTITAIVIVVAAAAGTSAWALTRSSGPSYRTATAVRGTVDQTLTTTGELSPVHLANADFQVGGTVAKVDVALGQKVTAGEVLARLDRSSLKAALGAARSTLTAARQRLSEDETSETAVTTATATSSTSTATFRAVQVTASPRPSGSPTSSPGGHRGQPSGHHSGPVTTQTLRHDQAAVLAAQHATDTALGIAKTALAIETSACATETSGSATSSASTSKALSCTAAAKALLHDQQGVNQDETAVDRAEQTLSGDLATAEKALKTQQKSTSTSHRTGSQGSRSSSPGSSTSTVSAADLATDQSDIDTASADVATAKASLAQATLHAAISGTIAAVTISKGDTVSGQSSSSESPAIEVIGSNQDKATVYVSATQVRKTKVGMTARITPDGSSRAVTGRVVGIGVSGSESDDGSISYPVTIDISDPSQTLVAGADAAVAITLATVTDVVAVPTSAVHYQGSSTYVNLLSAGALKRHTVTVGAVGPALTQVTSGLSVGESVVLANLNAAVPSSSSTLTGRGGFGGGFGGGQFTIRRATTSKGGVSTFVGP